MSAITIELDRDDYSVGDVVTGRVRIEKEAKNANHLEVSLCYEGSRVPFTDRGLERLVEGPVSAGDVFPFELRIPPNSPHSFQGHKISVGWYAKAQLDIPWAIDPREKAPFVVFPIELEGEKDLAAWQDEVGSEGVKPDAEVSGVVKVILLLIFGPLVLMLLPIIAPFALAAWAQRSLIRTRLRDLEIKAPKRFCAQGEWLPVDVSFELRKPVLVEKIEVEVKGQEHWTTSNGKNTQHHYHTFFQQTFDLTPDTVIAPSTPNQPGVFRARAHVQLNDDALPSMPAGQAVAYKIRGRVYLVGWPDPSETVTLQVAGARYSGSQEPAAADPSNDSEGLVFVPSGSPAPSGVDISVARDSVWFFLMLPFLGLAIIAADLGLYFGNGADLALTLGLNLGEAFVFSAVGLLLTLTGIAGIGWKVTR